jgi:2-iminobutanoate/2-iminopropanoate deaminase
MSLSKQAIKTDKAPGAIGPYSQAVKIGDFVYTSGQIPMPPQGSVLDGTEIRQQTRRALANVAAVLEASGSHISKAIKTTVFVMDLGQFPALNEEYENFFKEHAPNAPFPARSTVQVAGLPRGALVEIECVASL